MSKTLLLADDSVTIQKVVGISFANEDVRIVTVDNGDDAVARAREIKPDIVLADVVMPGKSGYDVCAAIKGDPELRGVPVLLLTGTFETFDEDRAARVGADGHITKPFEAQALVELVNARLASAAATRAAKPPAPPRPVVAEAEPEPFDFLEPEEITMPRPRSGNARGLATGAPDDAYSFEADPFDPMELETEGEEGLELGNEATEARTALLLEDDGFADAETAPPVSVASVGFSARDFESDEVTSLVLPEDRPAPEADTAPSASAETDRGMGDPLEGVFEEAAPDRLGGSEANRDWDVSSSEVEDPFETRVLSEPAAPEPATAPAGFAEPIFDDDASAADEFELTAPPPAPVEPSAPAGSVEVADATPPVSATQSALSAQLRDQMHQTLEKVAWEAFGDLSERVVREAVQRVEQVAWDVIPRLAETLIREEIRRLKGEE